MKGKHVSYMRFGVTKVEYVLGHQNGISAMSIWLSGPKKVVEEKIKVEKISDPMLGIIEMSIQDAEEQSKLSCDWST